MQEEWKVHNIYSNYLISNLGNVKNIKTLYSLKKSILNTYEYVYLSKDSKSKQYLVHKLVAETFLDKTDTSKIVNHIDGNKLNNNVTNLEWTTYSNNTIHAYKNNLINRINKNIQCVSKSIEQYDKDNKYIKEYKSVGSAAKECNILRKSIRKALNGGTNNTGFIWKYKITKININKHIEGEEWKEIINFPGYKVSNYGEVKNKNNQKLKPCYNGSYNSVRLSINGKVTQVVCHRLVALAFIPNPNNYPIVNHKDENKLNNHVSNLEWCTYSYNVIYSKNRDK